VRVLPKPQENALPRPVPRCVVFSDPCPRWQRGGPPFEQEGSQARVDHCREPVKSGKLALGGPFLDDRGGAMMVAAGGVGAAELAAFAAADPAVASALLTSGSGPG